MTIRTLTPPNILMSEAAYQAAADQFAADLLLWTEEVNALGALLTATADGSAFSMPYTVSATTTDGDPGAGLMRFDNFAAQTSATVLRFDLTDSAAHDQTTSLLEFGESTSSAKGYLRITKAGDTTKYLLFRVTAVASPAGYKNITVVNIAGSAAAPFAAPDSVNIEFWRVGDKGDPGTLLLTYDAQAANVQLVATDFTSATRMFRDITGSSAVTQTIAALATISNGDYAWFRNSSSAPATLDPDGVETINGAATQKVYPGESCAIIKAAAGFYTVGLAPRGSWVNAAAPQTLSAVATCDFQNIFTSDFDEWEADVMLLKPVADTVNLWLRTSTDGGITYDSGAANYNSSAAAMSASSVGSNGGTDTKIPLLTGDSVGNNTGESISVRIKFIKPSVAGYFIVTWSGMYMNGSTAPVAITGSGVRLAAADVDSFRLMFSTGNIASGVVVVRGRKA